MTSEDGALMGASKTIPGVNAFSVTHDIAMGQLQRFMGSLGNTTLFTAINQATIIPFAYVQYVALGAGASPYYQRHIHDQ
jgi:hypothetical protein